MPLSAIPYPLSHHDGNKSIKILDVFEIFNENGTPVNSSNKNIEHESMTKLNTVFIFSFFVFWVNNFLKLIIYSI